jgi:hypothetical protein
MSAMKRLASLGFLIILSGCASSDQEIRRLTPLSTDSALPAQCKIISIVPGSPAQRAGLQVGDVIQAVNGVAPKDAEDVSNLVNRSPDAMELVIVPSTGTSHTAHVALAKVRPRLGAVCDLSGWRKPGLTAAGNESVTVFQGALNVTASGILEKGLAFMRLRISNNSNNPLAIDPTRILAYDANHNGLDVMNPHQVMCYLYGDKGAKLLAERLRHKQSFDSDVMPHENASTAADESCTGFSKIGHVTGADVQYAQANAEYLASESLWVKQLKPGEVADGLVYLTEPRTLPITIEVTLDNRTFAASFGEPQGNGKVMTTTELVNFFKSLKKGAPLRVTTRKGKIFVGKFLDYDDENERAWFQSTSGLLNSVSYPLMSLRSAEPIDAIPAKTDTNNPHLN